MFLDAFPSIPSTEKKNEKREKNKGKKKKKISASSVSPDFPQEFHHFIFVKRLDTGARLVSKRRERERETRRQIKAARFDRRERRGRVTEKERTIVSFIFTVSPSQLTPSSQPLHSPHRIIQQAHCQQPEIHLNR